MEREVVMNETAREEHHRRLQEELADLNYKVERLSNLRDQVRTGKNVEEQPTSDVEKKKAPDRLSLSETLEQLPTLIRETANGMDDLVNDLRSLLF
jgi:hypothetical protein